MDPPMPPEEGYETEEDLRARIAELERENGELKKGITAQAFDEWIKLRLERDALRERDEQWRESADKNATYLEYLSRTIEDRQLATNLAMTALALRSEPLPKDIRERMEADRRAALEGE